MFTITQSNDTQILLDHLIHYYQQTQAQRQGEELGVSVFTPFIVIVPSMVLGDWLNRSIAERLGISTLFMTQFWGQYQWQLIQQVLRIDANHHPADALQVPEVAVLSGSVMRWRIFGFIKMLSSEQIIKIMQEDEHPLYDFLTAIYDAQHQSIPEHRLWRSCEEVSSVFVRYLTHRPEWLHAWTHGLPLPESIDEMIKTKDRFANEYGNSDPTPEWLIEQYHNLEKLLRYLWRQLFSEVYAYREALEVRFWAVLDGLRGESVAAEAYKSLPNHLYLFTIQQIPLLELQFLKRLSVHLNVHLLHFNPSKMFWADIVDKNWLATQRIVNPSSVYLKDYGHALLSRLGKESRETFAMLADMSGGDYYYEKEGVNRRFYDTYRTPKDWQVDWQDDFVSPAQASDSLLNQLKSDILMLEDGEATKQWWQQELVSAFKDSAFWEQKVKTKSQLMLPLGLDKNDQSLRLPSLSIHACHSLKRQLEVARMIIARYLNEPNSDGSYRKLSDIVVYLPEAQAAEDLIRLVFNDDVGMDGLKLPAKITGTASREVGSLMSAICGFYQLLGAKNARFYRDDVYEWLMTPALYESLDLDFESVNRACQLLDASGFRRGFDAEHLAMTLDEADLDYRYSFSYALDRIVAGFLMPQDTPLPSPLMHPFEWRDESFQEASLPLAGVTLADQPIVEALCLIHAGLREFRDEYQRLAPVIDWLEHIEHRVINRYFAKYRETSQMRVIFKAMNSIAASIRANHHYDRHAATPTQTAQNIELTLEFVLESMTSLLSSQAVSAEPAGTITFARFGALRSVPFGLTLMLDMNLSAFPRQDRQARLDLMKAGLKRRGDRFLEDDDNGAFLDAMLCSRDACAIFYTSVAEDGTQLLPAAPVSELIEFFKSNVDWIADLQADRYQADQMHAKIAAIAPKLVQKLLIYEHAANAFDAAVFYQADEMTSDEDDLTDFLTQKILHAKTSQTYYLPPSPMTVKLRSLLDQDFDQLSIISLPEASVYETLAQALQKNLQGESAPLEEILTSFGIQVPNSLPLDQIHRSLKNPAMDYLKHKLPLLYEADDSFAEEPLSLDGLGQYQLKEALIDAMAQGVFDGMPMDEFDHHKLMDAIHIKEEQAALTQIVRVYYDSLLPAGANRLTSLDTLVGQLADLTDDFAQNLTDLYPKKEQLLYSSMISPTTEQYIAIDLNNTPLDIVAKVPLSGDHWLRVLPNAARAGHFLRFYLHHLAWQVCRQTDQNDIEKNLGCSLWQFGRASNDLKDFNLGDTSLLTLKPVHKELAKRQLQNFMAVSLLTKQVPLVLPLMTSLTIVALDAKNELEFSPSWFGDWLSGKYDDHCQGQPWQKILDGLDPLPEIEKGKQLALVLYGGLLDTLKID
ncbi:exodeoxyribonuclease V subunit gamma [Moraxella catarrhalis]|uniref:Exodeoxyribonuclease V gamma chain n=1 Tax=Moraxella catarrhalis TaxID=480 RepID=A0A198UE39_MORCA|nr:exodeoxyribonuclease V subunit gamma [Moraxella catarrhalis]OAU94334.1 Exodeoxyribonuclease V gamma chain [Moraxella catarrhalis]OAU94698.1 Exodeoxyribonuclease V gamma chain [Moraxella catarrhalis]OAV03079.1 Exodeoxyribonuclease V gamma chain [Moraxella catarrhalis]